MIGVPVPTKKFHFGFRKKKKKKKKKTPHLVRLEDSNCNYGSIAALLQMMKFFILFFFIMGISDKVHEFSARV
jgi:hypothetical protein